MLTSTRSAGSSTDEPSGRCTTMLSRRSFPFRATHLTVADDLDAGLREAVLRVREGPELVAPAYHRDLGDLPQRERRVQGRVAAADHDGALRAYLLERRQPVREALAEEARLVLEAEATRA